MKSEQLVIVADIHFGLVGPQPDGFTYGDGTFILERAVQSICEIDPPQVILLGDLVNRGYDDEYTRIKRVFGSLWDRCVPVLGNHELLRASIDDFERNTNTRAVRAGTIAGLSAIILNSGIEALPDMEWRGALGPTQLQFVEKILPACAQEPLIVLVHHPIAGTTRDSEKPMFGLDDSAALQARLDRHAGAVVVFSAHTHSASFVQRARFSYIGAPPLGFWPHAFLVLDIEPTRMKFSTIRLLDDPDQSPDPKARDPQYRAAREGTSSDQSGIIALVP